MALSFDALPPEVLRSVLSYMDIASLGAVSATHRAAADNFAALAADDVTWYGLLQRRFGIGRRHRRAPRGKQEGVVLVERSSSSSLSSLGAGRGDAARRGRGRRPAAYGGATWKDAYRSLAATMRVPETRLTSGSGGHARGGGGRGGATFASPQTRGRVRGGAKTQTSVADFVGLWCMVHHAENCCTKTAAHDAGRRRRRGDPDIDRRPLPYRLDRRYIELKLCLQNTKSGFGRVAVPDVAALRIVTPDEEEYFAAWGWDKWDDDYAPTFQLVKEGPWAPKVLLRRRPDDDVADGERGRDDARTRPADDVRDLVLRPFEVVVLSVHVACPEGHVYETDVLASAASLRLPVVAAGWPRDKDGDAAATAAGGGARCRGAQRRALGRDVVRRRDVAVARFMSEDCVWDHFVQLPGGCLSLTDRSQLVSV